MLTPEPIRHLSLVLLATDLEAAARAIARVGVLHLLDVRHSVEMLGAIQPYDVSERLRQLGALAQSLDEVLAFLRIEWRNHVLSASVEETLDLQGLESRSQAIRTEVDAFRQGAGRTAADTERIEGLVHTLRALVPIGLPLEQLGNLRYVFLASGLLPQRSLTRLREALTRTPHIIVPQGMPGTDGRLLITALCLSADHEVLERALRSAHFERLELPPHLTGAPEEAMTHLVSDLEASREAVAAVEADRNALAQRLGPEACTLRARVERERLLTEARGLMGRSERISLITGWVPAVLTAQLEAAVRAAAGSRCVVQWQDPAGLEGVRRGLVSVPILLRNPVLIRPFERLLRAYGLPRYGELEPTAVVAVAFLAMFGFMFGDVGQGAVLFAIGYFMYRRMFRYRDYAVILMECGVFAMAFGFLYGSVFGVEHWLPALWLRPMEDMPRLMKTAVGFGAGFLSLALALNLVNAVRRRDVTALWERNGLLGALAYWIVAGVLMRWLTAGPGAVTLGTAVMWLVVALTLVFLKEPARVLWVGLHEHRWPGAGELLTLLVEAIVDVLDTMVSTVSNTATFIRLAAFAVSHAGLLLATFSVADAIAESRGGTIGAIIVIVIGNAVIIALEGLIVSIQSIRLEYYEFFSRFYSGGGEEYRPLRLASGMPPAHP
ncbi:MAG TPA: V-type ATPase 116kDa subunit family protein [Candidatus Binatia bacterium]